jgi:hypothetical protein
LNGKGIYYNSQKRNKSSEYESEGFFYLEESVFEGEWKNNLKIGKGVFYFTMGLKVFAEFKNNEFDG